MGLREYTHQKETHIDSKHIILSLADKLYICSRLLSAAAERLGWDSDRVKTLMAELEQSIKRDIDACVEDE